MADKKGTIGVKTQDILPIIKKWLYSEHDIFLRELVANATDAITKRATLSRMKNLEIPAGSIEVNINKTGKIITISDNGIGLSETEVEKYLATLAFSGAQDFIEKMKKEDVETNQEVIGKFGLGFYSSFMVADKVIVESLSMDEAAIPTKWTYEGDSDYTFSDSTRTEVGTTITLFINDESKDFLSEYKISAVLEKYCDFMPYTIGVLDEEKVATKPLKEDGTVDEEKTPEPITHKIINEVQPLWKKDPKDCTDEDYKNFYRKLFPMDQEPLFWIHLKVDHPFTLEGILFFPKINPMKPFNESNIKLYSKQVFVSDSVKNIIPEFLSLLKGTIDSTDIPLNVSRSSLQGDPNVTKISNYIVKKVAESLKKLFKKDREKYESIWQDIGLFVKYGSISDDKFDGLMRERILYKTSDDKHLTLTEYTDSIPAEYAEKMKGKVLYFEKEKSDPALRNQLKDVGVNCIETDDHIDPHFMQHAETKKLGDNEYKFSSVDSEIENILTSENTDESDIKIKDLFQNILAPKVEPKEGEEAAPSLDGMEIELHKRSQSSFPAYFKTDEQMKRFAKMAQSMGNNAAFPTKKTLVINPANPLIQNALKIHESGKNEALVKKLCHHIEDLAKISSAGLEHDDKEHFVQRSQDLIKDLTSELSL